MKTAVLASAILCSALAGCGEGGSYRVFVEFPDQQALDETDRLWVVATRMPEDGDCAVLQSGQARPGEGDYPADDQVTLNPNQAGGSSELDNVGPGPRLFFAEASNAQGVVILNGCTQALTGSSGDNLVTIRLDYIIECETDEDCRLDDLWCNGEERCQDGACVHEDRDCTYLEDQCNTVTCDEDRDSCVVVAVSDGTSCDDGVYCNDGETCLAGECQGGEPRDCSAEQGGCLSDPVCDEASDSCVGEPLAQGIVCDDGLFCTVDGECDGAGNCVGDSMDCSALSNQCNLGVCDEGANSCVAEPANQGLACDDGLYCTEGDACDSGACAGAVRGCSDDEGCTQDSCDEAGDACQNTWIPNPGAEGLLVEGTCGDSLDNDCDHLVDEADPDCQPCQDNSDCDDGNVCTTNTCNAQNQCETSSNDGVACTDSQNCTIDDECSGGICTGTAVDCSHFDSQCAQGVCSESNGQCLSQPVNQGQACADELYCTVNTTCNDGQCGGSNMRDCSVHTDACNIGVCNEQADQCEPDPRPNGTPCDDGSYCNGTDSCDGSGACQHAGDPCAAGAECQQFCNELGDHCFDPAGTACGDLTNTDCDDPDTCDGSGLCNPNQLSPGASCDDGTYCNGSDTCSPTGVCEHSGDPCLGGPECDDVCNETANNCRVTVGTPCGDQSDTACDAADTCDGMGECQSNLASNGTSCDDGFYCTGTDTCNGAGVCDHAGNPCPTDEFCDEGDDQCKTVTTPGLTSIEAGHWHTCGITAGGVAWCWGRDENGQVGNGAGNADVPTPEAVTLSGTTGPFVQLAAGGVHTCGLTAGGQVWCWGSDEYGQLGNGTSLGDSEDPTPVDTFLMTGQKAFVQLAAGGSHTCGLTAEGVIWCWGRDLYGQLGDGGISDNSQIPVAIKTTTVTGEKTFVSVTAGASHACGLTVEGVAWCWGLDNFGQLGDGGVATDAQEPVEVLSGGMTGEKAFVDLRAGYVHTCGLTAEGVVWCWGSDSDGQLGDDGGSNDSQSPVEVNTNTITEEKAFRHIEAEGYTSCGITADGLAWCWGKDNNGQLGNGSSLGSAYRPYPVDTTSMAGDLTTLDLAVGWFHSCVLTTQGVPWCFGNGAFGQVGDGGVANSVQSPVPVDASDMLAGRTFKSMTAGTHHTCALTGDGASWCWGRDWNGQLGNGGQDTDSHLAIEVSYSTMSGSTTFVQLAGGDGHTCGFTNGVAWCWGRDTYGGLGNGGAVNHTDLPDAVVRSGMTGEQNLIGLSIAGNHSCGLTGKGNIWCWGRDNWGQLGDGPPEEEAYSPSPLDTDPMSGETAFKQVAAGSLHTCGLTARGVAWCWGYDNSGQLGDGGFISTTESPAEVSRGAMTGLVQLVAGADHTCGLTAIGVAWCWGSDEFGQLGDGGTSEDATTPVQVDTWTVTGEKALIELAAGANHTCGLTAEGVVYCWGSDSYGQLGDGIPSADAQYPVEINSGHKFVRLAASGSHTCALTARGVAWCWGWDFYGQLGNGGGQGDSHSPVLVDTTPL